MERVSGKIYQETDMDAARRESSGYNVEELGLGFVRLQDGITLDIIEAWAIHLDGMEGSSIVGSQGGVRLEPFGYFRSIGHLDMDGTANLDRFMYRVHNVQGVGDEYDSAQHHWVAALQGPRRAAAHRRAGAQDHAHLAGHLSLGQAGPRGDGGRGARALGVHVGQGLAAPGPHPNPRPAEWVRPAEGSPRGGRQRMRAYAGASLFFPPRRGFYGGD